MVDYFEKIKDAYELILASLQLHRSIVEIELGVIEDGDDNDHDEVGS